MTENTSMPTYEQWYSKVCGDFTYEFDILPYIESLMPDGPILDIGCGPGRILNYDFNRPLLLLDSSKEFVSIARKRAHQHKQVDFIRCDACKLPLGDESIAGVLLLNNTLAEMRLISFFLSEVARVLKPGGVIFSLSRNPDYQKTMVFGPHSTDIDGHKFYSSFESFRMSEVGKYHYQTNVIIRREDGKEKRFFIPQVYPPRHYLEQMAKNIGLKVIGCYSSPTRSDFSEVDSQNIFWIAKKHKRPFHAHLKENLKLYDTMAKNYDNIALKANYGVPAWLSQNISSDCALPRINLDLCCGTGSVGKMLRAFGERGSIYGIDFSDEMLRIAAPSNEYTSLLRADLNFGYPIIEENVFDRIFLCSASEFIQDIQRLLNSCAKSLVRGGELFITFEKSTPISYASGKMNPETGVTKFHYSSDELSFFLKNSGLKILNLTEGIGYHSPSLKQDIPYFYVRAKRSDF